MKRTARVVRVTSKERIPSWCARPRWEAPIKVVPFRPLCGFPARRQCRMMASRRRC